MVAVPFGSSIKRYNDKITISNYEKMPARRYKQVSDTHKVDMQTGDLIPFCWDDVKRREKSDAVSRSRTRRTIVELSDKNTFDYFLTITFNQKFVDRSDAVKVHKVFKNIIKRMKHCYGGVSYVQVPEFHSDNVNIHYHLMINFARKPKLRYCGRSRKGKKKLYNILDEFKREDCFLSISPLVNNNTRYLIKYITKGHAYPLARKFSCTRDLNRSRLEEQIKTDDFCCGVRASDYAILRNFRTVYKHRGFGTFSLEPDGTIFVENAPKGTRRPAAVPSADLSYINTKDEILLHIWDELKRVFKGEIKVDYSPDKQMTFII